MLPIEWLRWTIILVCFLDSGLLIGEVFYTEFKQTDLKKKITVLSCIGVVHLAIVLTYKLYFFSAVSLSKADTSSLNT